MKIIRCSAFVFLFLIFRVQCFQPNCVPDNQFKFFKFPVVACSANFPEKCKEHASGHFKALGDAPVLKIGKTKTLPTCAFVNSAEVQHIYGVNVGIEVLATRSFVNLPNLKSLHLEFNSIKEVRDGVFMNVSMDMLDLSWNKIVFLDHHAFKDLTRLRFLNLSRNSLITVPLNTLSLTIIELNLSHNLLDRVLLKSSQFSNLTTVDLSNNNIENLAISFQYHLEEIDLTSNRLASLDYIDISSVNVFKMGKNMFKTVPNYLENLNAEKINIYPNPWKCDELFQLWEKLVVYNIRILGPRSKLSTAAVCGAMSQDLESVHRCIDDHECPGNMLCRAAKCLDPCTESACPDSSICQTRNHTFTCTCPKGSHRDPLKFYAPCKNVECYVNQHCNDSNSYCVYERCEPYRFALSTPFTPFTSTIDSELIAEELPRPTPKTPWWYDDIPNFKPPQKKN